MGKLGREKVCTLYKEDKNFEKPTDYLGVIYIPFDKSGSWRLLLVKELQASGYTVDANKLTSSN